MRKYTTVQGDMWDKIAFDQLGSENFTDKLISANPEHRDAYVFPCGIVLDIPDIDTTTRDNSVPPWKEVSV